MAVRADARGCVAAGTLVQTPTGAVAIERLRAGDEIFSVDSAGVHQAVVASTFEVTADAVFDIRAGGMTLRVTGEHPVQTGVATFTEASKLRVGDWLFAWRNDHLQEIAIDSITVDCRTQPAYNLLVSTGGTYLADGFAVHNKGCFLPNTPILMADGSERAISAIQPGDRVQAFELDGAITSASVQNVVTFNVSTYCRVQTDELILDVTPEHPFYVGSGRFKLVDALHSGDTIYSVAGGQLRPQIIRSITRINQPAVVYNLQTGDPHTFFAHGIAVHNKGGGGGHGGGGGGHSFGGSHYYSSSSGRYSSTQPATWVDWFMPGLIFTFVGGVFAFNVWQGIRSSSGSSYNRDSSSDDLDFVHSRSSIEGKAEQTGRLMDHLAIGDATILPKTLAEQVGETFNKLETCWQARDYAPMQPLLTPHLFQSHSAQLAAMVRQHEMDHIEDLQVRAIDFVHVRYTTAPQQREFTALITAAARDYYTDDRTGRFIRGDRLVTPFQEFWTFRFSEGRWLLSEIEQSRESESLRLRNEVEGMPDSQRIQIAGAPDVVDATSGGRLSRIDRQLNELVKKDAMWNRAVLMDRARDLFIAGLLAEEAGNVTALRPIDFEPAFFENLLKQIHSNTAAGRTVEYRNLCSRRVTLSLVKPAPAKNGSEVLARVVAHAQTVHYLNQNVIDSDPAERPFTKFVLLRYRDGVWRLAGVLMPMQGERMAIAGEAGSTA